MKPREKMRVLIVSSHCERDDVGESFNAYKWIRALSKKCEVVLVTQYKSHSERPSKQIPEATVIEWHEFDWFRRFERFNAMAKPWYPYYYWRARREIKKLIADGQQFDVMHHLIPIAVRYPNPCAGLGIPYIVGPLSGGLRTPEGFVEDVGKAPFYTRFRYSDSMRMRYDPLLRRSYSDASLVLGAAPYLKDILSPISLKRFEVECEVGIDELAQNPEQRSPAGKPLRLLYVGRVIRTKGLRDAVRAIAHLPSECDVLLTAAGAGEDLDMCRQEAEKLGVAHKINFLGKVDRSEVERLYRTHDIFLFPSFREPTGGVILEAMRYGLPVISSNVGGPGFLVTDESGIAVPAENPEQMAADLSDAIVKVASDSTLRKRLGDGARKRVEQVGLWESKINRMIGYYEETAQL
ncbi:glycosyltransferase involved in cell wall biosynthesis [Labrenzia sp. EL_159]|nr:glycosyltransferase involved in cell wall biosynthesis [Labrenzia sp. EL_162]MBG6160806.1 glycosyltransferase involved in cell wall biosynthesis [Labrenzia sp. EL_195]MBG6197512.1 glycosyltransferase involved in cell wall biosynthesis [Labrenzia sp. EL_159]